MLNTLKTFFGYDQFRPGQEEIINNVLAGDDAFVLMPTGGGKSLCYQLPTLKFNGLTLVISPLISLMKDQVDALQANGISAEFINSTLTHFEIEKVQQKARSGKLKILYLAPERLAVNGFQNFLNTVELNLIAIDEAHCISEWGHDFRPDYRNLKSLRNKFSNIPTMALTATATPKVRQDIIEQLNLEKAKTFIASFDRPNLTYFVRQKKNTFSQLIRILEKHKKSSVIIYCFSRKNTEELSADLQAEGFNALAYHAGLNNDLRQATQEKFITDEVQIIVATIAFGMGIDKPDVRLIVHYDLPKSIEGYYQETGRAGRDNLQSECVLFYSLGDTRKHHYFINQIKNKKEQENALTKLRQVVEFCEINSCRRSFLLSYFGEQYKNNEANSENCSGCDICLTPRENFDATIIAQKILSAVIRTGEKFGATYIVDILLGSKNSKIMQRGHNQLSVHNIVDDFEKDELKSIVRSLIQKKILAEESGIYPILSLTNAGKKFLQLKEKIELTKPRPVVEFDSPRKHDELEYDQNLFEKLRQLRKKIADQKKVPPFIIFGDTALREMAFYYPQNLKNFIRIGGVGEEKLAKFGNIFVDVICQHAKKNNLDAKEIPAPRQSATNRKVNREGSTYNETKKSILQKIPIEKIAKIREMASGTILSHLEKIIATDEKIDIDYLKPNSDRFEKIKTAFKKSQDTKLAPVREILGEEYSYDELRLARIFLE